MDPVILECSLSDDEPKQFRLVAGPQNTILVFDISNPPRMWGTYYGFWEGVYGKKGGKVVSIKPVDPQRPVIIATSSTGAIHVIDIVRCVPIEVKISSQWRAGQK